jgi:hypothetical protein
MNAIHNKDAPANKLLSIFHLLQDLVNFSVLVRQ